MSFKPGNATVCPRCREPIFATHSVKRLYGTLLHRGCYDDLMEANAEVAQVQEATRDA